MLNDSKILSQQFAMAARVPELDQCSGAQDNVTEQFLLSLFRFVQFTAKKSNLSAVERVLLKQAKDVFIQLAEECEMCSSAPETLFSSPEAREMTIKPLPGNFEFHDDGYQERKFSSMSSAERVTAKKTAKKKSGSKKAGKKNTPVLKKIPS